MKIHEKRSRNLSIIIGIWERVKSCERIFWNASINLPLSINS